jgi:hypothetical protein
MWVHDVRQMDIHMIEPLVSEPSLIKLEIADQISAKLIKAGDETFCSEICRLIRSIWNKEELPK